MKCIRTAVIVTVVMIGIIGAQIRVDWIKTFGGDGKQFGHSVQQTIDKGYIIVGETDSFDDTTYDDVYLLKTDSLGTLMWQKTFGGTGGQDEGYSIQQTADMGYIITGMTNSFSGTMSADFYLIKTDLSGNIQWQRTFGSSDIDYAYSVQQTVDNGYIVAGGAMGESKVYLIKTDSIGNLQWQKNFGASGENCAYSVQQIPDKGFIITGKTEDFSPTGTKVNLIKIDSLGNLKWQKNFGYTGSSYLLTGKPFNEGKDVQRTFDGGYIITGGTYYSHDKSIDVYLIKTDTFGNLSWQKNFGGDGEDEGQSVRQTIDKGYIITGWTHLKDDGNRRVYILKTDSLGNPKWTKTFGGPGGGEGNSVQQTQDGGYIITGTCFANDNYYVYLIKLHQSNK